MMHYDEHGRVHATESLVVRLRSAEPSSNDNYECSGIPITEPDARKARTMTWRH